MPSSEEGTLQAWLIIVIIKPVLLNWNGTKVGSKVKIYFAKRS